MNLELKYLSPYLPYGLMMKHNQDDYNFGLPINLTDKFYRMPTAILSNFKPILRRLSDLTKEIEHNGEIIIPSFWLETHTPCIVNFKELQSDPRWIFTIPQYVFDYLLQWHFDVFGLIEKGLAIDINELDKN